MAIFVFSSLLAFIAKFALSLGIEFRTFSLLMIPLVLMMTLGFFLGGRYSDRVGRSNMIFIGFTIAGPLLIVQGLINSPVQLIIIAGIVVLGIGLAWPTIPALIIDSVPEHCRATGASIYNTFRYITNASGPIVMGYIIGVFSPSTENLAPGIRVSYYISGFIYIIACIAIFFLLRRFEAKKIGFLKKTSGN